MRPSNKVVGYNISQIIAYVNPNSLPLEVVMRTQIKFYHDTQQTVIDKLLSLPRKDPTSAARIISSISEAI